jgi:hypothetical protein
MRKLSYFQTINFPKVSKFRKVAAASAILVCLSFFQNCSSEKNDELAEHRFATEIALEWNRLMLDLERHTPGYRPPVSARTFAYVEMAAYEASLPGLDSYVSLENYCPGYVKPPSPGKTYLPASLNVVYAQMLRHFFPNAPKNWQEKIGRLERDFFKKIQKTAESQTIELSLAYGKSVADAVWNWSATDVKGHNAFYRNFDSNYVPPVCEGCWQPDKRHPVPALLPEWGKVRSFVVKAGEVPSFLPIPFDATPGSAFYTEAMEVFSVSQPLSKENTWIAELWSDDLPGLTVTPAGRWISIANQAIAQARPPFPKVMETYLKTAFALCDASVVIWESKYHFNVERPEAYINRNIKSGWRALHENPSFPAYPSGHSAFGAAAAEILSAELGEHFQLTDRTHEHRQEFVGKPRTYQSFAEMAKENAASRVLIGVHYRMDCEEGLRLGKIIGKKVAALPLQRNETALTRIQ